MATASGDNTVTIVPLDPRARPVELRGHTGRVTSIAFSPADDKLVTTSADSTASSVLLPMPLGPMSAATCPRSMVRFTSRSTGRSP